MSQRYTYTARDAAGRRVSGEIAAESVSDAADQLALSGHVVLTLTPPRPVSVFGRLSAMLSRVGPARPPAAELIMFCRQMTSLLRAGVPLTRAVDSISETTRAGPLKRALKLIGADLQAGSDFSTAVRAHPEIFSTLFASLVESGESVGRLDVAFADIATNLERERETLRRVWAALRYPMFVISLLVIALIVINLFAIPIFTQIFSRVEQDLPLATRLLMGTSDLLINFGPGLAALLVFMVLLARLLMRTPRGRLIWDRASLRIPVVGPIFGMCVLARLCRGMAMTVASGIPLLRALTLSAEVVDNRHVRQQVLGMRQDLERGEGIAQSASLSGLFSPLVVQMMAVGEEAGTVDELMNIVGQYYENEASYAAQRMSSMLQPALLLVVGGIVALVALGVFLPMWGLMDMQL